MKGFVCRHWLSILIAVPAAALIGAVAWKAVTAGRR